MGFTCTQCSTLSVKLIACTLLTYSGNEDDTKRNSKLLS